MATPCSSGASSTTFPRETTASVASGEVANAHGVAPRVARAPIGSTFAACLELFAKEARASKVAPSAGLSARGAGLANSDEPQPAAAGTGAAGGGSADRDTEADRVQLASDVAAVGHDATIDPIVPILVALAPRGMPAPAAAAPDAAMLPGLSTPIEQLMSKLVRRIAWSGNARTGSARLEFGAGALEGATLTVHADDGVVRVALELPPGVDPAAWKERIAGRLGARGLQVEALEVA